MVLSAGQNCIHDADNLDKTVWENRTQDELSKYASVVTNLMKKGKKVFILSVPASPLDRYRAKPGFSNKIIYPSVFRTFENSNRIRTNSCYNLRKNTTKAVCNQYFGNRSELISSTKSAQYKLRNSLSKTSKQEVNKVFLELSTDIKN